MIQTKSSIIYSSGGEKMFWSNNIKYLRKNNNESQEDLANALGVSQRIISYWENEKTEPDIKQIIKIAHRYKISTDYLLNHDLVNE
jgi:transcriptional regulator with XRE-family HTH domain